MTLRGNPLGDNLEIRHKRQQTNKIQKGHANDRIQNV